MNSTDAQWQRGAQAAKRPRAPRTEAGVGAGRGGSHRETEGTAARDGEVAKAGYTERGDPAPHRHTHEWGTFNSSF
jgi:hypothetical protein